MAAHFFVNCHCVQTYNGAIACQMLDRLHPGVLPMRKVDFNTREPYQIEQNWRLLQHGLRDVGINYVRRLALLSLYSACTLRNLAAMSCSSSSSVWLAAPIAPTASKLTLICIALAGSPHNSLPWCECRGLCNCTTCCPRAERALWREHRKMRGRVGVDHWPRTPACTGRSSSQARKLSPFPSVLQNLDVKVCVSSGRYTTVLQIFRLLKVHPTHAPGAPTACTYDKGPWLAPNCAQCLRFDGDRPQ